MAAAPRPEALPLRAFVVRVGVVVAIVLLAAMLVLLRDVVVLVFGSIAIAVALRSGGDIVAVRLRLDDRVALGLVVVGAIALITLGVLLLGDPVAEQLAAVRSAWPPALEAIRRWLDETAVGKLLIEWWHAEGGTMEWGRVAGIAGSAVGALGTMVLMLVVAVYLAADPALYRRGLLLLLPPAAQPRVDAALRAAAHGLSRWLVAQGVAMLAVGVMTAIGLALIGMPLAIPLGVIAGLLEFVPFLGTFASSALIVLLGFAQGPQTALYAALVCLAVQQVEGYVIQPIVGRWAIALPPALALVSVIAFGVLFGPLGLVFAVPLAVVAMQLVQGLYVDGALHGSGLPIAERLAASPVNLHPEERTR